MTQPEWVNLASLLSLSSGAVATGLVLLGDSPGPLTLAAERSLAALARLPIIPWVLMPALSLGMNILIAARYGIPIPLIHDEFSYLLAADTFAHGRLTNPPPPFPEHFETPQQLMRPTYMSKYPPGQGIALATGEVLLGQPICGEWLFTAAAVAAVCWMLLAFVPRHWAMLGGFVAAVHPQLLDWSQNYWGGDVAVLGGALLLGAWGQLYRTITTTACCVLAAGLIILANTRPFEGLMFAVPLAMALMIHHRRKFLPIAAASACLLVPAATAMAYYNFRVTGHPLRLPFTEYAEQYDIYPKFWFLPPHPAKAYQNPAMQFIHGQFERDAYQSFHSLAGAWANSEFRFQLLFTTHLKLAVLLLPLLVGVFGIRRRRPGWVVLSVGFCVLAIWTEISVLPHYEAPLLPAFLLIIILGWRQLSIWKWRGRSVGRALSLGVAIGFVAGAGMAAAHAPFKDPDLLDQAAVVEQLPSLHSGRHIVFVEYAAMHSYHAELVHNLADLDHSRILWVRYMGRESDRPVAAYFADRQCWSLYVGGKLELQPYLRPSK